jgi:hypothetical protein
MRTFANEVYDTNGATPQQNAVNKMNERTAAQNDLAKSGGGTTVPQFSSSNEVSPINSNSNAKGLAEQQLRMDSAAKAQANTGQKIGGKKMKKRKTKKRKTKKRKNRKSRKY